LLNSVRHSDIVCRLGGDEFVVICPHSNYEAAHTVAQKILKESVPVLTSEGVECWNGSLSIGIAESDKSFTEPESLIDKADKSLYISKEKGGGTIS
jgi:hemerythrin